ncbi:MAG TPA: hypothetical protein VFT74_15445, partial [Isosphaeraceae bacterium]|nr:hypothetical protein [Isosphaeraceae bacterium]
GSLSAFVVILIHFWKRIIPRTCPICGRRRLILRRTDRVRADVSFGSGSLRKSGHGEVETLGRSLTHKRRQWSCLSCGAEDTILVGRSMTEASELAGSEFS